MPRARSKAGNQGGYQPGQQPGGGTPTQPATADTGLPYGEHQALVAAQQAVPLPATAPVPTAPTPGVPAPGTPQAPPMDPAAALQMAAQSMRSPDERPGLFSPSRRPSEPVTAGLPSGPGAGPEALGNNAGAQMADLFARIAQANGDPALARLAELARRVTSGNT